MIPLIATNPWLGAAALGLSAINGIANYDNARKQRALMREQLKLQRESYYRNVLREDMQDKALQEGVKYLNPLESDKPNV